MIRDNLDEKSNILSSKHCKSKLKPKISLSDQSFENQEEELIRFKEEHHDELRRFLSGPIQNEVLTINF